MGIRMIQNVAKTIAVFAWLGSFALVIPAEVRPPKGMTLAGFSLVMYAPMSWLSKPELYMIVNYSYWIGLMMLLVTSVLVILALGRNRRVTMLVAIVDLTVIALSILTSIFGFAV